MLWFGLGVGIYLEGRCPNCFKILTVAANAGICRMPLAAMACRHNMWDVTIKTCAFREHNRYKSTAIYIIDLWSDGKLGLT